MTSWGSEIEGIDPAATDSVYFMESFGSFYRRELPAVAAILYAMCGNRWASVDLANDAFLAVFRGWDRISTYDRPGAFVRRVAINLALSRRRRMAVEARGLARLALRQQSVITEFESEDAEFWATVRRLPRRQCQVVVLRYVEDMSVEEIADVLTCAPATVRVHLHRAHIGLARRLGEEWGADL